MITVYWKITKTRSVRTMEEREFYTNMNQIKKVYQVYKLKVRIIKKKAYSPVMIFKQNEKYILDTVENYNPTLLQSFVPNGNIEIVHLGSNMYQQRLIIYSPNCQQQEKT